MAITVAMRTQVTQLYVSLFGRAPDGAGLDFWVQKMNNGASFAAIAQQMYQVDAARVYYPSFLTNEEIVAKFYMNVLGRKSVPAEALDFWVGKLNAKGATPGGVIAEMINSVVLYEGDDAAALRSQDLLVNKVEVGLYFALSAIGDERQLARYILDGITANPSTVAVATAAIDSGNVAGMWNPEITSASFDASTGKLVVTGANFGAADGVANDVIANKLTITGEGGSYTLTDTANVDITSSRSFTLTLGATDRAAVAALLNKDGAASTGGVTYNLAAAEDWFAGIGTAQVIADLLGNGITVTQRGPASTASFNITGNELDNVLVGTAGDNVIDGKGGADTMRGGAGDDTYRLDSFQDVVLESSAADGGIDLVIASGNYELGAFIENLRLARDAMSGMGNGLGNVIDGNAAGNFLDGRGGVDTLRGGAGDDLYCVDRTSDVVIEVADASGGRDDVLSSVDYVLGVGLENLTLTDGGATSPDVSATGNGLANVLVGNMGANDLSGGGGRDTLDGGLGRDVLSGGAQADVFRFMQLPELDRILDFVSGTDRIDLSFLDANAVAAGDQAFTFLGTAAFGADATGQLRVVVTAGGLYLQGSTDADATAEFSVRINGSTLAAGDLIL